jgi:hypothetical protein
MVMAIDDMESAATARRRAGLTASTKNAVKKKTPSKTIVTPGTKVSQATIDKIKAMGMKKALAGAANASPEMREGLKRMYGAKRVGAAATSSTTYKSADAARSAASSKSSSTVYKSADAARSAATRTSMSSKPATRTSKVNPMAGAGRAGGVIGGAQNMPYKAGTKTTATNMPYKSGTKYATVAAINAKRMGITVAEYNKRMAAAKKR